MLHRQHANLNTSVAREVTSCTPGSENTVNNSTACAYSYNLHAVKVISAAQSLTKLITLPCAITHHTPFFVCACTLASIIHLSCWSFLNPLAPDEDVKQQLRLCIGALKKLAEIWPGAAASLVQVQGVAQEMFVEKKRLYGFWNTFNEEDILSSMITDGGDLEIEDNMSKERGAACST